MERGVEPPAVSFSKTQTRFSNLFNELPPAPFFSSPFGGAGAFLLSGCKYTTYFISRKKKYCFFSALFFGAFMCRNYAPFFGSGCKGTQVFFTRKPKLVFFEKYSGGQGVAGYGVAERQNTFLKGFLSLNPVLNLEYLLILLYNISNPEKFRKKYTTS